MSFIYVIFNDDVDIYWARERVLERLSTVTSTLPTGVTPNWAPMAPVWAISCGIPSMPLPSTWASNVPCRIGTLSLPSKMWKA